MWSIAVVRGGTVKVRTQSLQEFGTAPMPSTPGVNLQREAVVFDCALGEVALRYAAAITVPELKNQRHGVGGLVGEVESSRVLGVGELRVRFGVLDDQLGDDDLDA